MESKTALLCWLPGLGDAFTSATLLRRLNAGGYSVDVLSMLSPVNEYASSLEEVRSSVLLPLLTDPLRALPGILALRRRRYDLCIVPFPATRWQYAAVAAAVCAKRTVLHRYGGLSTAIAGSVRSELVPLRGGHRIWENDRIADKLGLPETNVMTYIVPSSWRSPARESNLVGIHPGTMIYKGNETRRWPLERFMQLVSEELKIDGRRVRLFFGPNEREDREAFARAFDDPRVAFVAKPLEQAARALCECTVFVGNDAGFSHLAAALGVTTIVLFGMTDPVRARPVGPAIALRPSDCPPCHDEGMRRFDCARKIGFRCLNDDLRVDDVVKAIDGGFAGSLRFDEPLVTSPFQLYGSIRSK